MTTAADAPCLPSDQRPREIWGQPRGLAYIAFTEAWERFSFYGMQALLVLDLPHYAGPPDKREFRRLWSPWWADRSGA